MVPKAPQSNLRYSVLIGLADIIFYGGRGEESEPGHLVTLDSVNLVKSLLAEVFFGELPHYIKFWRRVNLAILKSLYLATLGDFT